MSNTFEKFQSEIAAGGAVEQSFEPIPPMRSVLGVGAIVVLLAWLLMASTWMFVFVVGILISVFLHEVGHYVTARRTGMKVTQFYMGFGPRLWCIHRNGIEYGLRAIPLGAFVRIIGMNNIDDVDEVDRPFAYQSKSYPRRMLVITAGSIMHMIIAVVLLVGVYAAAGRLEQRDTSAVRFTPEGSPAALAGLQPDDRIVSVGGIEVSTRDETVTAVQGFQPGDVVPLEVIRRGEPVTLSVTFSEHPNENLAGVAYLGVALGEWVREPMPLPTAVTEGVADLGRGSWASVKGLFIVFNPVNIWQHVTGQTDDITTRPATLVGATQVSDTVGKSDGLAGVLTVLAAVNVFVGILNMAPVLPLDGGHAAIATYERIRSRNGERYHADVQKMVPLATVVVAFLLTVMVAALYLDITNPL
jgi:membrane-associated protease RseP (regulator of RpoE activity)